MSKSIAIHQPYLFPYIGYFQLINSVDTFILADDLQYIKGGWINRNYILVGGNSFLFTLPLEKASQNKKINELEIKNLDNWRDKFLKTLRVSYAKTVGYEDVFPLIESILSYDYNLVSELIQESVKRIANYLGIQTNIKICSLEYDTSDLQKEKKILAICDAEKAVVYINMIGGAHLYDNNYFMKHGVLLKFLEPCLKQYPQKGNGFIERLSIIDVLMNNSQNELKQMLAEFHLH